MQLKQGTQLYILVPAFCYNVIFSYLACTIIPAWLSLYTNYYLGDTSVQHFGESVPQLVISCIGWNMKWWPMLTTTRLLNWSEAKSAKTFFFTINWYQVPLRTELSDLGFSIGSIWVHNLVPFQLLSCSLTNTYPSLVKDAGVVMGCEAY